LAINVLVPWIPLEGGPEMIKDQIVKKWSEEFVNQLQQRYGLAEEEARKKVDLWFESHEASDSDGNASRGDLG
jgi:hypothetical protein